MPDTKRWKIDINILEEGDIFFFYKPKDGITQVKSMADVARFYIILSPSQGGRMRFLVMGQKKLPIIEDGGQIGWGFVEFVGGRGFQASKAPGKPNSTIGKARPIGEGLYSIVLHANHSHLVYSLEHPPKPLKVQRAFNINKEGSYVFITKKTALRQDKDIQKPSFVPLKSVKYLNQTGREFLLIGSSRSVGKLGLIVDKRKEDIYQAQVFNKLKLNKNTHPIEPIMEGEWK